MGKGSATGWILLLSVVITACGRGPALGDRFVADVTTTLLVNDAKVSTDTVRWNATVGPDCIPNESLPHHAMGVVRLQASMPTVSSRDRVEEFITFKNLELPTLDGKRPCFSGYFNTALRATIT